VRSDEIGDCRNRYPDYRALAADAGQCPVAVESGKSRHAKFRWACDHRLRDAFDVLADSSRHHNPWATDIYTRARARGAGHAHATRILGRAWTQIIWRLWQEQDTYDPHRPRAIRHWPLAFVLGNSSTRATTRSGRTLVAGGADRRGRITVQQGELFGR
jgi:hypothetical protein